MSYKSKALGFTLFAVLALSAVSVSGASAAGERFHAETAHTTLDFTQDGTEGSATATQKIATTVGEFDCTGMRGTVTLTEATPTAITLVPDYAGCFKIEGGGKGATVHVRMRSCDYLFTSEKSNSHGPVHIRCTTPGDHIQINATILGTEALCIKIPAQTPTGGGATYHNVGSGTTREVTIEATVTGIEYTEINVCGSGTVANDGTYTGNFLATGTNTVGEHEGVWWE